MLVWEGENLSKPSYYGGPAPGKALSLPVVVSAASICATTETSADSRAAAASFVGEVGLKPDTDSKVLSDSGLWSEIEVVKHPCTDWDRLLRVQSMVEVRATGRFRVQCLQHSAIPVQISFPRVRSLVLVLRCKVPWDKHFPAFPFCSSFEAF